jgi:glucose-1-phosphate adenylyltransferase
MNAMAILFSYLDENKMGELTRLRAIASLPFGGRYRIIDFILSSLVNSGVTNVGVIAKNNYHSLMDHLGTGKEWDLSRKRGGLFLFPPFDNIEARGGQYRGKLEALAGILSYIRRSLNKYVILADCNMIYNLDFTEAIERHARSGADITALCAPGSLDAEKAQGSIFFGMDEDGRINDCRIYPNRAMEGYVGMGIYIMERTLLEKIVVDSAAHNQVNLEYELLQKNDRGLDLRGVVYDGYVARIHDIDDYFAANMQLLDSLVRKELFYSHGAVYTKVRDSGPTRYGANAHLENSLVADGCKVDGTVINSILFRDVRVAKGAVVKNSIIMQSTRVGENVQLCYVIADKDCVIGDGHLLMGFKTFPVVIGKGRII